MHSRSTDKSDSGRVKNRKYPKRKNVPADNRDQGKWTGR